MKKVWIAALGLMAATWQVSASAKSFSDVCNGCSPQQVRQMVAGGVPQGDWFILDMVNRNITHFSVISNKVDVDKQTITNVGVTPAVQNDFNHIQALWDVTQTLDIELSWSSAGKKAASANQLRTSAHVMQLAATDATPIGGDLSAFDLINTPANQSAAINQMMGLSKWGSASLQVSGALASFASYSTVTQAIFPRPVNIQVTIKFTDGSTSVIAWNLEEEVWEYKKGSSRDAIGNPIPENPDQAVGGTANNQRYVFPNSAGGVDAAFRQSQNFSNIGLPVGAPVFRSGASWSVACVRVGGPTGTVSCTATPL